MVTTFAILGGFRSLRVPSIAVATRFVVTRAITVPSVLSWGIARVWAVLVGTPIVGTIFVPVPFLSIAAIGASVSITATGGLGAGTFLGFLFLHHPGIFTTAHVSVVATFEELLKFEHVSFDYSVFLGVLHLMSLRLSKEHLFAELTFDGQVHTMAEVAILDVIQYLDPAVEKFFEPHVGWFASQTQPANDLVAEVSALGDGFKIVLHALLEVLLGPLLLVILGSAKVPFGDGHALEAAAKEVELFVDVVGILLVILFPSHQELRLEVRNGVGQRVLWAETCLVGCDVAGHFSSARRRP